MLLPKLKTDDGIDSVVESVDNKINQAAQAIVVGNIVLTIFLVLSLKSMWNLLNVMQVLVYMRYFTNWPATVDDVLLRVFDAITLRPFTEPVILYGKDKFEIAVSINRDEFMRS